MFIRAIKRSDIDAAAHIYDDAREFMRATGNPTQWSDGYPNRISLLEDMKNGVGYVCEEDGELLAVFMFSVGRDPTYDEIYDGCWLNDEPYAVIHRIAVSKAGRGRGVAAFCFADCFSRFGNLRIDTHRDNAPMQRALDRAGFKRCGVIYLQNGEERIAYQKVE